MDPVERRLVRRSAPQPKLPHSTLRPWPGPPGPRPRPAPTPAHPPPRPRRRCRPPSRRGGQRSARRRPPGSALGCHRLQGPPGRARSRQNHIRCHPCHLRARSRQNHIRCHPCHLRLFRHRSDPPLPPHARRGRSQPHPPPSRIPPPAASPPQPHPRPSRIPAPLFLCSLPYLVPRPLIHPELPHLLSLLSCALAPALAPLCSLISSPTLALPCAPASTSHSRHLAQPAFSGSLARFLALAF
jgi:hypothetical protein